MKEILKQVKKLSQREQNYLVYQLLVEDKISFTKLSELYVESLKKKEDKAWRRTVGFATGTSLIWKGLKKTTRQDKFIKCKLAYHLISSGLYFETEFEEKLKQYLIDNPYEEDEHGFKINN